MKAFQTALALFCAILMMTENPCLGAPIRYILHEYPSASSGFSNVGVREGVATSLRRDNPTTCTWSACSFFCIKLITDVLGWIVLPPMTSRAQRAAGSLDGPMVCKLR